MNKRSKALIVFTLILLLSISLIVFVGRNVSVKKEPLVLNVSLYKNLPDYDAFEKTVEECWKEKHPDILLSFSDWDCYSGEAPDDLDVFVFDTLSLDAFIKKGYLLELSEKEIADYEDLIAPFVEGCRDDGKIYALPQMICTDLLYTRKENVQLRNVTKISELYDVLGDDGLLFDERSSGSKVILYLQTLTDEMQHYIDQYPPVEEDVLSKQTVALFSLIGKMYQGTAVSEDDGIYDCARRFAQGEGRAYIGYSEAMNLMGDEASKMDFRLFSMSDDDDIPVFYVDAVSINARISNGKKGTCV